MKRLFVRYRFFLGMLVIFILILIIQREKGLMAVDTLAFSLKEVVMVIPPVFILLGLMDVWVPRETMVKYMGEGSGIKGILLSFFCGSVAAGPLYAAFPVAAVFMRKGVSFINLLVFIGAWSTTKVPMLLFEISALGAAFAYTRLGVNIPVIVIIAVLLKVFTNENEREALYRAAERL